jgi:signal transduction histidine kinase
MGEPAAAQTILIVDDTPANLGVMVQHLEDHGFQVLVAQDGAEGLRRAADFRPDLILLDITMPGLDGFTVCRRLKGDAATRHIPVIFMTALTDQRDKLEGFAAGGVDYVTKPLHIDEVTARVRTHLELNALRQQLAAQNRLLTERSEELAASNRELEAFSYSVSHDLRTPLRAIDGFSRMLANKCADRLDDEGRRLLRVVRDNAAKMAELIDGILEFAKSGRGQLRLSHVDVEAMVREVWADLESDRAGRQVQLQMGPLPAVRADPNLLRQVWANLLSNAIKFTRPRAVASIEVGGSAEAASVSYFVKDNGTGFDPAYQHKLFGVFERLHGVGEFEGSGIGLAIVARIVARHGGRVGAQGAPDQGATFHITLPA